MKKVHLMPVVDDGPDPGLGGIHRVELGQVQTLPEFGWEVTEHAADADLIACHVSVPESYLNLYPDTPIVVHNHGLYWEEYDWDGQWHYRINQDAMDAIRMADGATAVSEWTAQALRRASMRDVRVIHHGVDIDDWPYDDDHGGYVLWNKSRIDPVCDPAPLDELAQRMPRMKFVTTFSGDGERRNVQVTGLLPHEDAKQYIRRAGVYLATTRETFGIGTLEALACGVPVVGYDWGGQTEIIEHGVDGWLVRPHDIDGLIEGVSWAMENRPDIAPRAREKAAQFPVRNAGQQYAALYDEVLERFHEKRPKVSVIVTAYDLERFLPAALDSVAAQSIDDWECIVVDDASPDGCFEIATEYAERDPRFKVIRHETNRYLAAARNTGIAASRGKYVIPLDADDRLHPRTLEVLSTEMDRDRRTHVAYGNVRFYEEDQETLTVYENAKRAGEEPGHSGWPMVFRLEQMMRVIGQLMPYCSMFRRTVWELTGGYRERCRSSEDQDFWLRACSYGFLPRYVTKMDTLLYTNRADSMSSPAGEGWEQHRPWYPWAGEHGDRSLTPAAAYQDGQQIDQMPMPCLDPTPVAVVIPVGPGHQPYVLDAIDSVDAQTERYWECIVVNDTGGPLPNLPSWVRVIEPEGERFGSVAAARNAGIAASRSPYFLPLDADDYLQPHALRRLIDAAIEHPNTIIYPDWWEDVTGDWTIWQAYDYDPEALLRNGSLHAVTAMTPKKIWTEVGGYLTDVAWEDWAFQIQAAAAGRCSARLAAPLFNYRKHTGLRRNDNMEDFEGSKRSIMEHDFGIAQGGVLLACSSCPSGQQTTIASSSFASQGFKAPPDEHAVLVRYTGAGQQNQWYRSKVNRAVEYKFSANHPELWVHEDDAELLVAGGNFEITEYVPPGADDDAPLIVASRTPALVGATAGDPGAGPLVLAPPAPPAEAEPEPAPVAEVQPAPQEPTAAPEPVQTLAAPEPPSDDPDTPLAAPDGGSEENGASGLVISVEASAMARNNNREVLNQMARELGIAEAETHATKSALAQAIIVMQGMKQAMQSPPQSSGPATPV